MSMGGAGEIKEDYINVVFFVSFFLSFVHCFHSAKLSFHTFTMAKMN